MEPALHRSDPVTFTHSDDPLISYYVFLESFADGDDPYLHLVGLAPPYGNDWWAPDNPYDEVMLSVENAEDLVRSIGELLPAARSAARACEQRAGEQPAGGR